MKDKQQGSFPQASDLHDASQRSSVFSNSSNKFRLKFLRLLDFLKLHKVIIAINLSLVVVTVILLVSLLSSDYFEDSKETKVPPKAMFPTPKPSTVKYESVLEEDEGRLVLEPVPIPTSVSTLPLPSAPVPVVTTDETVQAQPVEDMVIEIMKGDGTFYIVQNDGYHNARMDLILKKFYESHPDIYDFVSIWDDVSPVQAAIHRSVQNKASNIGYPPTFDDSREYGSNGRLLGINNLNNINNVDLSWDGVYNGVVHETAHQWLTKFYGTPLEQVINKNSTAHWSPFFDLGGIDPMGGGSDWVDNVDGTCQSIKRVSEPQIYSWLSLYYMGLAGAHEVPEYMYVQTAENYSDKTVIECIPKYYSINDFIDTFGERTPPYGKAQKDFTMAFILVLRSGNSVTPEQKEKLITIAKTVPEHWNRATRGRSTINKKGIVPNYTVN